MVLDIFAGMTAWAVLCAFFVALLSASGRHARSTTGLIAAEPTLVSAGLGATGSRRSRTADTAAFTLDLDPYGLDHQVRRLVSASTAPSK